MVRPPLSQEERDRGIRLGELLRAARGERTSVEVAQEAGISVETLRKIEHGRVPMADPFSFSALGHRWIAHEWLGEALMGGAYNVAGFTGLALLIVGIIWLVISAVGAFIGWLGSTRI